MSIKARAALFYAVRTPGLEAAQLHAVRADNMIVNPAFSIKFIASAWPVTKGFAVLGNFFQWLLRLQQRRLTRLYVSCFCR